ncbi:sulfite oxidase [Tanacetum coccineum]
MHSSIKFLADAANNMIYCNNVVASNWGGAKLADVLELVGIPKLTSTTPSGGKHVEFVSVDRCKEENGGPYKASIPLSQATNPEADVLLAYEMNGETLNRDHGYPLRVVVPGVIGARSVKWLDSINIDSQVCQGFFMQKDYKMFPPSVNWDNIDWSTRRPQMDFPVQSAICSLEDVNVGKYGKFHLEKEWSAFDPNITKNVPVLSLACLIAIKGYAVSGGGRGIERVDISSDGGKTWKEASRYQKPGVQYVTDDEKSDKWAWVLFEAEADVHSNTEIVAKAIDTAANVQPEKVEDVWNLRGILNTSWHRVQAKYSYFKAECLMEISFQIDCSILHMCQVHVKKQKVSPPLAHPQSPTNWENKNVFTLLPLKASKLSLRHFLEEMD